MKREMHVISTTNSKGGVGKTASTAHLGAMLASMGYNVMLIDMDKRAVLSMFFDFQGIGYTTSDVLSGAVGLDEAAVPVRERLWLVPASSELERTEVELTKGSANGAEVRLKRAFRDYEGEIDFAIIDCPGDWNIVTRNALMASNWFFIPINSEPHATTLAVQTAFAARELADYYGHDLRLLGVLLTHYRSTNSVRMIERGVLQQWPTEVFDTRIRRAERINELAIAQQTTSDVRAADAGAVGEDYSRLAQEIIERTGARKP